MAEPAAVVPSYVVAPYPTLDGSQLCAQVDVEMFFPEKGGSPTPARQLCASCDFLRPCLAYALTHDVHGVWGGTSQKQRRTHQKAHGIVPVPLPTHDPNPRSEVVGRLDDAGRLITSGDQP